MNETINFPGREPAWFFTAEDRGEFSVLKFGRHIPERATDLGQTEKLWGFLEGSHVRKVLLVTTLPGSLSPASMDDFWEHVRRVHRPRGERNPAVRRKDSECRCLFDHDDGR